MAWFASQLTLLLVLAFLLGLLLGYLVWIWGWRRRVEDSVEVTTARRETAATPGGAPVENEAAVAARDARIAELEEMLRRRVAAVEADRDERVAALEAERDRTIEEREATVAQLVADRNRRIAAAEEERDELERRLAEQTARAAADRDERVAGLEARVAELRSALEADDDVAVITVVDDEDDDGGAVRGFAGAITTRAPSDTIELRSTDAAVTSDAPARTAAVPVEDELGQRASATGAADHAAAGLDEATVEPDDLTRVEGIGPKMQAALHDADILTFERLAACSEDEIRAAIAAAGMRFAPSVPTWAKQASYLAEGDDDGLAAYQDQLVAGREEAR